MLSPPIVFIRAFSGGPGTGMEIDVSWDFEIDRNLEGWANATSDEMQMEVRAENGELRASIVGSTAALDSPALFLQCGWRHYLVVRMMYSGMNSFGTLLLKAGMQPTNREHVDWSNSVWTVEQNIAVIDSSPTVSPTPSASYDKSMAVDGNQYTYFLAQAPGGVYITFDLGADKWISTVTILGTGDRNSPKRCLVQKSGTISGLGPWETVSTFTLEQDVTEYTAPITGIGEDVPTAFPTASPTLSPSALPTTLPTASPTASPTAVPTRSPTYLAGKPTPSPTQSPTMSPTIQVNVPSALPTKFPPTASPTMSPSSAPTRRPTASPTLTPTLSPATVKPPTAHPSPAPTYEPGKLNPYVNITSNMGFFREIKPQTITNFNGHARYWRLLIVDNYGGPNVGLREISFQGYSDKVTASTFDIDNTGKYKTYYLPFTNLRGNLLRVRLSLTQVLPNNANPIRRFREALSIDYIRIAKAPDIRRVTGCLDRFYPNIVMDTPYYNVTTVEEYINGPGHLKISSFIKHDMPDMPYASTYDCPPSGGVDITVEGLNFGPTARVFIDGNECPVKSVGPSVGLVEKIICVLPPGTPGPKMLRVQNGILPGLFQEVPSFAYRTAPPGPDTPIVTNAGAYRVDLVWKPPGNVFDNMMTTGYQILWFRPQFRSRTSNLTVGNITTTSIRGLKPGTEYVFAIAAMSEGAYHERSASLPTDLYGRRDPAPGAIIGAISAYTNITATTQFDFFFDFFNANKTVNSSGSSQSNSLGPTGQYGSEGHYGLIVVGNANIQNCNVSSTCCDGYNATIGIASCGLVCAVYPDRMLASSLVIDGITRRLTPSNLPYDNGAPPEIVFKTPDQLIADKGADLPSSACGPALRLTPSEARQSGSAWYPRKMNVREGFDTLINFEISNPSQRCDRLDDVNTFCRSRGADGFAFVLQNVGPTALGLAGSGLGYDGIFNSLAVEVDTYHNYDLLDYYENHISIQTQGFRYNITANHSRSLATTNRCPDLTDGRHTLRIRYDPNFDENAVPHPSFQVNGFASWFMENGDWQYGGIGDWGLGFGLMYIYIDDLYSPVITTPINLDATIQLDDGRAYVGITAATGDNTWQAHDIISWQFSSLFIDQTYEPPIIVNGVGDIQCRNMSACIHFPDYDHYMRKNNVPPLSDGHDSVEEWMSGSEGLDI